MKRLIAALAALWMLVSAQPSTADKLLGVYTTYTPYSKKVNDDNTAWLWQRREIQQTAETLGIDMDLYPDYAVSTIAALTSNYKGTQYAGTVYIGYRAGDQPSGFCSSDSVTIYSIWDGTGGKPTNAQRKPQLYFGVPNVSGNGSAWKQVAAGAGACSTGTDMTISSFPTPDGMPQVRSAFLAGSSLVWKEWNCIYPVPRSAVKPPGILRTIIGYKIVDGVDNGPKAAGDYACLNCDAVGSTQPALTDSLGILWARYRDPTDTAPLFFCWPTANSSYHGGTYSQAAMVQAFAALDSITGKKLIGQKPGWKPVEISLFVGRGFSQARPTVASTPPTNYGGFALSRGISGNAPDTTFAKSNIREFGTWGVPVTLGVNPDSVKALAQMKAWWEQIPSIQYAPEITAGLWTGVNLSNAGKYAVIDPFGFSRSRAIGYYGNPIADTDTTMQGLLRFARARIDSIWPGQASRAVFPGNCDGIPSNFALRNLPNIDTYNMALWTAGFRVVIFAPDAANSNPGMTWGVKGNAAQSDWATNNYAFGSAEVRYNVYTDSTHTTRIGSVLHAQCPTGLLASYPNANLTLTGGGHNAANDFLQGVFTRIGLSQDYMNYYHSFRQPRRVFRVDAYSFAGQDDSSVTGLYNRYGYWQMKQIVMSMKAVNALAGREIVRFVYAGEL